MRRVLFLGLVAALTTATPAFALREIMVGNAPIGPGSGHDQEVLDALNVPERVILAEGGLDASLDAYFKGGPKALNDAFRKFAAIPADTREIRLVPFAARSFDLGKEVYPYDWELQVPGLYRSGGRNVKRDRVGMVVHIPNVGPPA